MSVVIRPKEIELAIAEMLGKCGARGKAGYDIENKRHAIDFQESRLDLTKFGQMLSEFYAKQPRHYGVELETLHINTKLSSIE